MGGGVNSQGKAAGNDKIVAGQFRCQPFRHLQTVRGGRPGPYHGDARGAEKLRRAQDVENRRRIVYFLKQRGKERIVPAKDGCPGFFRQMKLPVCRRPGNPPLVAQAGKTVFA